MSEVSGYFLVLNERRSTVFVNRDYGTFAEPVLEFTHSRNIPLICFVLDEKGIISHVGWGSKGQMAGTDLRRLNVKDIHRLNDPIPVKEIIQETDSRIKHHLSERSEHGGMIPPRSLESFLKVLLERAPELKPTFEKYTSARRERIERLSDSAKKSLAEQKEAILTALNIAGIDKSEVRGWDYSDESGAQSFLDGIEKVRLREDTMIINDLTNFPGYELIKSTTFSSTVFQNEDTVLTVLLANRLPLEELTGTDLIYFNENFRCFVMIQYKVMEKESDNKFVFRVPNPQLAEEIERMDSIYKLLEPISNNGSVHDFRISSQPFFIKLCPRIDFHPDHIGLSKGMYVPLEYFKVLQADESIKGARGGRAISFQNVGRYLDNTDFKTIIEGGWIGTYTDQSSVLQEIIKTTLENGKAIAIALKKTLADVHAPKPRSIADDILGSSATDFESDDE